MGFYLNLWSSFRGSLYLIDSHEGFDTDGKVIDAEKAIETIKSLRESMSQLKESAGESGKSLREAIKAYREANPRPEKKQ